MEGRCIGSPGTRWGPLRKPHIMFRLRCRSIRRERLNSGAAPISERSSELQQHTEAEAATIHPVAKPRDRAKEADAARAGRRGILHRVVCTGTPAGACRRCPFRFPECISRGLPDHESRPHIGRRTRFRASGRRVATSVCRCENSACETAARAWQRNKHVSCVVASLQSREGSRCRECSRANA